MVFEEGMFNVFLFGEFIGLLWVEWMGCVLEEVICYWVVLLGIVWVFLNI